MGAVADSPEAIVYDEALRMVSEQRSTRDSLRTRAGILLAASSLVTSFLGGLALTRYQETHPKAELTLVAWSGVVAFLAVVALVVLILAPWKWTFAVSPKILIEDHLKIASRRDPDKLRWFLAEWLEVHHDRNAKKLNRLFLLFVLACGLLIYESVAWVLVIQQN